ncbi:hypothetical protein HLK59_39085 [Streptomyces sp. S3(2020)]|uniref:hypothetical protein n=1 Tax=Streptomyces sp. S3(2020) TaxID=2732044 RepID=UPI001487C687|nr:hypothetical protein [Streptomyces sp. S3(2020)]
MPSSSAGIVTGLTAAALVSVGFLAYQASASVPPSLGTSHRDGEPAAVTSRAPRDTGHPTALPVGSGKGERVVYSVDDDRVWLVDKGNRVQRTFKVTAGTVDPVPGSYFVTSRSNSVIGTDGTPIEHVVRFAGVDGVTIGFSAAVDGSAPENDPTAKTGGIRESREDGNAMWDFATIGQRVLVIR